MKNLIIAVCIALGALCIWGIIDAWAASPEYTVYMPAVMRNSNESNVIIVGDNRYTEFVDYDPELDDDLIISRVDPYMGVDMMLNGDTILYECNRWTGETYLYERIGTWTWVYQDDFWGMYNTIHSINSGLVFYECYQDGMCWIMLYPD